MWLFFSSLSPLKNTLLFWHHGLNSFSWSVSFTLACQVTIHINTDFHPGAMLESHFLTSATSKNRGAEKSVSRTLALVTFSLYICLDIRELFFFSQFKVVLSDVKCDESHHFMNVFCRYCRLLSYIKKSI